MNNLVYKNIILLILLFSGMGILIDIVLPYLYHPNISELIEKAAKISHLPRSAFKPEPLEKIKFLLFFIALPLLSIIYYFFVQKKIFRINDSYFKILNMTISLLIIVIFFISLWKKDILYTKVNSFFEFYFLFVQNHTQDIYFVLMSISFAIMLWSKVLNKISSRFVTAIFLLALAGCVYIQMRIYYPTIENAHHFEAVFFSQYNVSIGEMPLLVNGFKNTYGLYPHFLDITIFKILPLTIESFKNVMIVLNAISAIFLFLFLKHFLNNKSYLLFSVLAYIYYVFIYRIDLHNDFYFQYTPLRIIFPFLTLYLITLYEQNKSNLLFFLINIITSIAILWQPDSGISAFLIWSVYLIYINLDTKNLYISIKKILYYLIALIFCTIVVFLIYSFYISYAYSENIEYSFLFSTIKVFSALGFYMLPIQKVHPYMFYILLIVISSSIILSRINNKNHSGLLLFTVWAVLAFMYFQGRSHTYTFLVIIVNILILLPLLLQSLLELKINNNYLYKSLKIIYISLVSFLLSNLIVYFFMYMNGYEIMTTKKVKYPNVELVQFIRKHIDNKEKIFILSKYQAGAYYCATKALPAFNTSELEMFYRKDFLSYTKKMKSGKYKVFMPKTLYLQMKDSFQNYVMVEDNVSNYIALLPIKGEIKK